MREIKFRAWDKEQKKMRKDILLLSVNDALGKTVCFKEGEYLKQENAELMQYTGLKDSKGVEIYEGDIVTYLSNTGMRNAMVYWRQGTLGYQMRVSLKDGEPGEIMDLPRIPEEREIIGNIWENPELLK